MMLFHKHLSDAELRHLIRSRQITLGGNSRLKIYGMLRCGSGKRMNRNNRVFFSNERAAQAAGYRPCGHCMKAAYRLWKAHAHF